jgi:hypothetical protein
MSEVRCSICGAEFDSIPPDAIQVGRPMGVRRLLRFADGSIHDVCPTNVGRKRVTAAQPPEEKTK